MLFIHKISPLIVILPYMVFLLLTPGQEAIVIGRQDFSIQGDTSVGEFRCTNTLSQKDSLSFEGGSTTGTLKYKIPGKEFACGNFMLNRDFRRTIKVKEYAYTDIEISGITKKGDALSCNLILHMAGKEKKYSNLELRASSKLFEGSLKVNFSDFGLKTPSKMGGLVKVSEKVTLSIQLHLLSHRD